jgi:GPH family glycoside/pentoside/hexuronide:cation symporter
MSLPIFLLLNWVLQSVAQFWMVLAWFNYESNSEIQSESAVQGVILLFTLIPSLFYLLTAFSIKFYDLTENVMNGIVRDLNKGEFAKE